MKKQKSLVLMLLTLIIIAVLNCGCNDNTRSILPKDGGSNADEPTMSSETVPEVSPEIPIEPVSEEPEDYKRDNYERLIDEENVIIYAENNFPDTSLFDKNLFKMKVTDVTCCERDIIEYLLEKQDRLYMMDSIKFESSYSRHDAFEDLIGIHGGDYYSTFCKINLEVERIWTYDYEDTLSLDRSLFSAKVYSKILEGYEGTEFSSSSTLFVVDDCESDQLLFDKDTNFHTVEVITAIHYDEYSDEYDNYNVMFGDSIIENGSFDVSESYRNE